MKPPMIELPPPPPPSTWEGCELTEDYCASEDSWDRDALRSYGEACARAALEAAAQECEAPYGHARSDEMLLIPQVSRNTALSCAEAIRALKVTP